MDLLDFFQSGPAIVLALECMSTDLSQVMEECYDSLPKCLIKCWMQMLFKVKGEGIIFLGRGLLSRAKCYASRFEAIKFTH